MRQSVSQVWVQFNAPFEALLNFMYLDNRGLLTTGLGNLLDATQLAPGDPPQGRTPTPSERAASHTLARQLAWKRNSDNLDASPTEIDAEWDQIRARLALGQQGGGHFQPPISTLHLEPDEITRIIDDKLQSNEQVLTARPEFADLANWPADAQLGLLSMAWAMGPQRFDDFKKFRAFVQAVDWNGAASECRVMPDKGTLKNRNIQDAVLFRNAAAVVASGSGLNPDDLVWPSSAPTPTPTAAAPNVTGLTPSSGAEAGNTPVTITGSGFTGATDVGFGSTGATAVDVLSDYEINVTSPSGTGIVDVTVITPAGTSATNAADQYSYTAPAAAAAPDVSAVSPSSGLEAGNTPVSITGSGFTGATDVGFGPTGASAFDVIADSEISVTSPPGTGTVDVTVVTPAGTSATTAANRYSYTTAP